MRIIKYTHSCVRLVHDNGGVLVIDPGIWSEPSALTGADGVLVTHEHTDHVDVLRLAGLGAPVFAPAGAAVNGLALTPVAPDQQLSVAGFGIRAVGGRHASVYDGSPACANLGYLIDDSLYHPGDSLYVPDHPVETLLVPIQASWLKTAEAIEFVGRIAPDRVFGIHDAQLNDRGLDGVNGWLDESCGSRYRWLRPGEAA